MTQKTQTRISFMGGLSLAIGSIIGSGVLFLPAMTTALSGRDVLWVWLVSIVICIPLIYIFVDIVADNPSADGLSHIIELGFGKPFRAVIPYLFLGTVSLGMPTAAFIVGQYVTQFLHMGPLVQYGVALCIVLIGVTINLAGVKTGQRIQIVLAFILFLTATLLIVFTYRQAAPHYGPLLKPHVSLLSMGSFSAVVVAFWAYAGFENLTFISGEFGDFKKHFRKCIIIALLICGVTYAGLSLHYAALVPKRDINIQVGLFQLSMYTHLSFFPFIITVFAFFAVQINFNSWIWGISRLIQSAANEKLLPQKLVDVSAKEVPTYATMMLGVVFCIVLTLLYCENRLVHLFLVLVSTNFVFIYILCLLSYVRVRSRSVLFYLAIGLLIFLIILITSSKWFILYPLAIVLISRFLPAGVRN